MKEIITKVPPGIQYISEWADYDIPEGYHCIVDKGVTGCGYTELCLTNSRNIVLCSPRKLLLENKRDQHKGDPNILYLENDIENFNDIISKFSQRIVNHWTNCQSIYQKPCKFLITYDSTKYIVGELQKLGILEEFTFVVDECQSIFMDAFFKSEVEFDFVEALQDCLSVIYLSATPMMKKYLEKVDEFKDLTYHILDWSETGYVETVLVQRKNVNSLYKEAINIITKYLNGDFPIRQKITGELVESRESVFYMNSISDITKIVKATKLTPKNTVIICSNQEKNKRKLRKVGFKIGKVPLKDEPNPMFMFCTSAVYVGVDMYSDNASTYIFADPNFSNMATDISQDLPQIVGRQRDKLNPFKNEVTIFYKKQKTIMSREEFDEEQLKRRKATYDLLDIYDSITERQKSQYVKKLLSDIKISQYSGDFVSISKNTGHPVYNGFIELAYERAWEVEQEDYQNNITVAKAIENAGFNQEEYKTCPAVDEFLSGVFYSTGIFEKKMKAYCEFRDAHAGEPEVIETLRHKIQDRRFCDYYEYYKTPGCKARKFREIELCRGWKDSLKDGNLEEEIRKVFVVGGRYSMSEAKKMLGEIYGRLGITRSPKATDLGRYFILKKTSITLPDKSVVNGYKLLKKEN